MIRNLAIAANIGLIGTAVYLWMVRQGMPDTWEKWFFFSIMLIAPDFEPCCFAAYRSSEGRMMSQKGGVRQNKRVYDRQGL